MRKTTKSSYNRHAAHYHRQMKDPKTSFWNTFIERPAMELLLRKIVPGKSVLDLGCGSGLLSRLLKDWGAQKVSGVDFAEGLIDIARRENPNLDSYVAEIQSLPFSDASFDAAVSSLVLHYVKDLAPVFAEVARILKPEGSFVFSWLHPRFALFDDSSSKKKGYAHTIMKKIEVTVFQHELEDIESGLEKAGMKLEHVVEPKPVPEGKIFDEQEFLHTQNTPTFLVVIARLPATGG